MAANVRTEMRIPTRAAPRPPTTLDSLASQRSSGNVWGSSNDLFGSTLQVPQKKKPPPRPPPPKFVIKSVNSQEKPKKPARPTELITNLFVRRGSKQHNQQTVISTTTTTSTYSTSRTTNTFQLPPSKTDGNSVCLIDLSPPGSPTFTTRSSSDGVSVDSFGSDGNSNPSVFTSSGSTSQTESAFEDDFDFFGSLSSSKKNAPNDPWRVSCSQDPFGSLENNAFGNTNSQQWTTNHQQIKEIGDSNFFAFNDSSPFDPQPQVPPSKPTFTMPTIIRVKPRKDAPPKPSSLYTAPKTSYMSNNYSSAPRLTPKSELEPSSTGVGDFSWDDSTGDNSSPPMPSLPPPPPPPEYIAGLEDGLVQNSERPYGVALYDFPASQSDDLDLKEGDVVYLTKLINDNWMEGRVGSREGMFPVNFVDIKIPLPGLSKDIVNALYAFKAETSEDLSFEEGARIKVLSRISDDWLYGEYQGKKGQFPANFVDKVPSDLPNHL